MQISQDDRGQFRALCPELGVSTLDTDRTNAVDRLKSLIFDWLLAQSEAIDRESKADGDGDDGTDYAVLTSEDTLKLVHIPRRGKAS
ncbi:hypothetical protein GX586_09880 [bacterium]|nr:hypothetical protein [bacterium]